MKAPHSLLSRALLLVGLAVPVAACVVNQKPSSEMARLPPPATPPQPVAMNPAQALGLWQSSFGAVKIESDPSQPDRLMGIWLYDRTGQEVIGFFTGPLRGNVFEFTWHEPNQPQDLLGAGFLRFEPDGSRFAGTWWPGLLEKAAACGLRSLFVGFETLDPNNLHEQNKVQNLNRDYEESIRRLHDLGVMINASFVFGMDNDDESVFEGTVEWAIGQGIETSTFHILTPYPGTALDRRMQDEGRIITNNWDLYDTRHVVFQPAKMSPDALEAGYWHAYQYFYRWGSIFKGAWGQRQPFLESCGTWILDSVCSILDKSEPFSFIEHRESNIEHRFYS